MQPYDPFPLYEVSNGERLVSTDRARLDFAVIHGYLAQCYWSAGISREQVERQTASSLAFGLYEDGAQLGFARVVTDYCRYAYLCDVFIVPQRQGQGLGKTLLRAVLDHPELAGIRRWVLLTNDAHELYRKFGFTIPKHPEWYMENTQGRASERWR